MVPVYGSQVLQQLITIILGNEQRRGELLQRDVADDIVKAHRANFEHNFPRRLKRAGLIISGWDMPQELDEYLNEAHLCYLHGILIASMVMAITAIEASLRIKYTEITGKKKVKRENGNGEFEYLIKWARQKSIIDRRQAAKANKVRRFPRNKLVHIKAFTKDELEKIYALFEKKFEELSDEEREMLGEYLWRTDPTEKFAEEVLETADEIVMHIFPSIGRIPFSSGKHQQTQS